MPSVHIDDIISLVLDKGVVYASSLDHGILFVPKFPISLLPIT